MTAYVPLVRRLAASVSRSPRAEAVVYSGGRLSYAELWAEVSAVAVLLRDGGVAPGDRVAVVLDNSPHYIAAYYGALAAGAVAVGLNAASRGRELSAWLEHCGARWAFVDPKHPDFRALVDSLPADVRVVATSSPAGDRVQSWPAPVQDVATAAADVGPDELAAIVYTSGTTGRPKGVALTHGNLSANTASIIEYLGLTARDRVLNVLPFFYSYGASVLHTHLAAGGTLVLENSLAFPQRVLERMVAERVTGFPGVPSTFSLLMRRADFRKADLDALRYMTQAGGAMPASQVRRMREVVPHAKFFVMYGQTEATARLTYLPPDRFQDKQGSVGVPVSGVELEVRSESGDVLPAGQIGLVCARGPNIMAGYYRDPEATAGVIRDGWLHTGDMGYLDADGFLFLEGRRSDIIKTGAYRVSPQDVEDVIASLSGVAEVAVVGIPDDTLGEAIKAVVALEPGAALDALAIQRHCSLQLPRYKVPKTIEFAQRLPRTTSGKVMRFRLSGGEPERDHRVRTA